MIQINKVGNAIVIKFTDNDKYLFNGTIEVAPNELMVVVDQSNMVTFKKMSNGDTLFGQSYEKIRINDEPVTKENIVEKFATIGFTSGSGGISDAPSDNKLYGRKNGNWSEVPSTDNFATKQEISDMLTKSEAASTYQPKGEYLTSIPEEYVTNEELTSALSSKQDKGDYATTAQLNSKQDTLVSGTNIKTINGNSLLGEGDITIQAGGTVDTEMSDTSENAVQNKVIKKYIDDLVGNILTQLQEINGTN